jgi:hypothetical protein
MTGGAIPLQRRHNAENPIVKRQDASQIEKFRTRRE